MKELSRGYQSFLALSEGPGERLANFADDIEALTRDKHSVDNDPGTGCASRGESTIALF
ncbi:hypothetical protein CERSUDRAFT_113113 [Gelatoporia subvermispora B]|uniref:Uncharacterized protein n=1 Tax=Ceriporiopsis subvermispora (strain B) TaxID=914234 RepID=M2QLV4_CERS8|nr:hypothetical protein CERSUDRAFT_113113 [Gelatoporia subvermispora B]